MINLVILGSTGSIGTQALALADMHPELIKIRGLAANSGGEAFKRQIAKYKPDYAALANKEAAAGLNFEGVHILSGPEGICELASLECADVVLVAVVGIAGLDAVLAALKAGKRVALANKEALVAGGECVMKLAGGRAGERLLPVDSEHSAIFQCLNGENIGSLERLILTASGGPLLNYTGSLKDVTVEQALSHPNWSMGPKISVDSATLMNKGLEVIEARWLFDVPGEKIEVSIHPESIVHSMIEFRDGAVMAQLGCPDMRVAIMYALTYPQRQPTGVDRLDFGRLLNLSFLPPDTGRFPCLELAYQALKMGGTAPAVLNGANEEAVKAFLSKRIGFGDIPVIIEHTISRVGTMPAEDVDAVHEADRASRIVAGEIIKQLGFGS